MGLFEMEGGAAVDPMVNIGRPLFDRIAIHLDEKYYPGGTFVIETKNNAPDHYYIQSATFYGKPLDACRIEFSDIVAGGKLELTMGRDANKEWGMGL